MPLSNEQIVDSLIAFYRQKDMDLTYMLDDPLFDKMPVQDKVDAIKRHARTIYDSSPAGLNSVEKKTLGLSTFSGAVAGLGTALVGATAGAKLLANAGIPLASKMSASKAGLSVLALTGVAGAATGGLLGYLGQSGSVNSRKNLRDQLGHTVTSPTDMNAIGTLAVKHQFGVNNSYKNALVQRGMNKIEDKITGHMGSLAPEMFANEYLHFSQR